MDIKSDTTWDFNHDASFGDDFEEIPLFQDEELEKAARSAGGSPVKDFDGVSEPIPRNFDNLMAKIIEK